MEGNIIIADDKLYKFGDDKPIRRINTKHFDVNTLYLKKSNYIMIEKNWKINHIEWNYYIKMERKQRTTSSIFKLLVSFLINYSDSPYGCDPG